MSAAVATTRREYRKSLKELQLLARAVVTATRNDLYNSGGKLTKPFELAEIESERLTLYVIETYFGTKTQQGALLVVVDADQPEDIHKQLRINMASPLTLVLKSIFPHGTDGLVVEGAFIGLWVRKSKVITEQRIEWIATEEKRWPAE